MEPLCDHGTSLGFHARSLAGVMIDVRNALQMAGQLPDSQTAATAAAKSMTLHQPTKDELNAELIDSLHCMWEGSGSSRKFDCSDMAASDVTRALAKAVDTPSIWRSWLPEMPLLPDKPRARVPSRLLSDECHSHWIVITSIALPTEAIRKWNDILGWKLVVVRFLCKQL